MNNFIYTIPKAELHVHLEGTLEPALAFILAKKNGIALPFDSIAALKKQYDFTNLSDFLRIYYTLAHVLQTEHDFYVLTTEYLEKAVAQGVLHAEIAFEVQTYMHRNISFATILNGMHAAIQDIQKVHPITVSCILTFLRDRPVEEAHMLLEESVKYKHFIHAIGLASAEVGNPPLKFLPVYQKAKEYGYRLTAHAGEEAGPESIWQALELGVERIDHGIQCLDDPQLVATLKKNNIPLTVCPLSNVSLKIVRSLEHHPVKRMLSAGLNVSLHSDDPAYFHGYIGDTYVRTQKALTLSNHAMIQCAYNSINSSFISDTLKEKYLHILYEYIKNAH